MQQPGRQYGADVSGRAGYEYFFCCILWVHAGVLIILNT
jgi:hypothetical protein